MRGLFLFLLPPLLLAPGHARPSGSLERAERLIAEARALGLEEHPHWLKLIHYRGKGAGRRSDIDGGYFFLSPRGKTDSRAELEATLRALLSEKDLSPPLDTALRAAAMHPLVKFPARLRFLRSHLDMPDSVLPPVDRSRFLRWSEALQPRGATLIYASSYLNNPASTFGHTFLRLDTHAGDSLRAILNYGITYAATVPEGDNLSFAYKGIFGKYPGTYTIIPYFLTLQKYSHLESRDIWEYPLRMDSLQLRYLVEHTWEVGAAWMRYFFFDENCSYNIMTLLDAADPDWNLAGSMGSAAVVPSETVKILEREGLVSSRKWRPSLLTSFRLKTSALDGAQRRIARRLLRAPPHPDSLDLLAPEGERERLVPAMDAVLDYVQYRKRKAMGDPESRPATLWGGKQRRLLLARSRLTPGPETALEPDQAVSAPEESHGPHLVSLGAGGSHHRPFAEGAYSFIRHDLNAREAGYLPGSQIEALELRLRVYCREVCSEGPGEVRIQSLDVLDMLSLTPLDAFRKPVSWGFRLGYDHAPGNTPRSGGAAIGEAGAGFSASRAGRFSGLAYLLLQGRMRIWRRDAWGMALGPQTLAGLRLAWGRSFSVLAESRLHRPFPALGPGAIEKVWSLEGRLSTRRDLDLRLGFRNQDGTGEAMLSGNAYF